MEICNIKTLIYLKIKYLFEFSLYFIYTFYLFKTIKKNCFV